MSSFTELLGEKLLSKDGEVESEAALSGKVAVALYFSAHWCPPCRGFTPKFAEWYNDDLQKKGLEVIFVSSDRDEESFEEYRKEQPWLALPYSDRSRKEALSKKFKIQGIPSIVILDANGKVITKDGRAAISNDPTGADMPWMPKTFKEIFSEAKLLGPDGVEKHGSDLEGKVLGLYFSAHWCPPCRGFTPKLVQWYNDSLKEKLEVVFVSGDRDEGAFKEYFGEQPWLALDYADRKRKLQLDSLFAVQGIPTLVIIGEDGSVITKEGREAVSSDPTGAESPWYPKPVSNLKSGPGKINEVATVIAFCDTSNDDVKMAAEKAMEPLAKKYLGEAKAEGEEDPKVAFMMVTESSGLAPRIRGMLGLEAAPLGKHEHPLAKMDNNGGWGCDGCGQSGAGKERYRCTKGCDFDLCGECNALAGAEAKILPSKLMLLDIPDQGAYYEGPEGDITSVVVEKFVDEYFAKSLTRKQLEH